MAVVEADVRAIAKLDDNLTLAPHITAAGLIVEEEIGTSLSDDFKDEITKWLAAHLAPKQAYQLLGRSIDSF